MPKRKAWKTRLTTFLTISVLIPLVLNSASTFALATTVGWWHFDEGSGSTAYDSSIFGNDGTIYGATWVDGKFGKALSFDGVDDYVSIPDSSSLDLTEITIEAWVNVDVLKNYDAIAIKGYDGLENCEALSYSSGMVHCPIKFTDGTRDKLNSPAGAIAEDLWHHVAMTYKPGEWRIFIDGFLVAERRDVSKTPLTNNRPLIVGAEEDPLGGFMSGRFFNGIIDELKISNVALTALEIAQDAGLTVMPPVTGCFGTVIDSYQDPSAIARTWVWTGYNPTVLSYSYSWTTPNPDPEAGNHLDLTWVNPVGTNSYVTWDMGCPVLGVRVYPTQDHLGWDITNGLPNNDPDNPNDFEYHEYTVYASNDLTTWTGPLVSTAFWLEGWVMGPQAIADDAVKDYDFGGPSYRYVKIVPLHDEHAAHDDYEIDAVEALELPPSRTLDKRIHKKVKVIPAPVQFWREFIGGVTDIIVFDPPEITEPVALVREYAVLHAEQEPIPLEFLTWNGTEYLPWEPIDTPQEPYILPPDGIVEYDIPTLETDTAVLVRYTVAWASTPDVIEAHFINEAILESRSPQVIIGQLTNFDVHNDYHEPVDNFELELYGIQPSDVVDWFPGWGTPPEIHWIPPSGSMPAGTEIIWMDSANPVIPCHWEHFGLHLKPGVIAVGVKAYWTQVPSAELGDTIHTKIEVTVPPTETVTVVDTLPPMVGYINGTFTVDGVPALPTITKTSPPPPITTTLSYTITTPGTHLIEFDVKVDETKSWEDTDVCNVATATWFDEAGDEIETKEDVECFTIHPFEQLHKNVGIPKADVVFAIDLTSSMAGEIATVKTEAANIMNRLAAQIADVQFGLISFMDYDGYYTTYSNATLTWYNATYGSAASGDYPYNLDQDITNNIALMTTKINGLTIGWGADGPQDYTRIIHEAYNDTNLHWRTGAKRILILFGDNVPHDTDFDNDNDAAPENTGGDPGRDTLLGTADDLNFETEVANAAAAGVHIMAVYSGWTGERYPWTYMANLTSGGYFELTEAEQIPDAIKELIKQQAEETLTIKEGTDVQWALVMDVVNPYNFTMKNVTISDNFGAELEIEHIVTSPDTNVDGVVDIFDLAEVASKYGIMALGHPDQWDPVMDINNDDIVDARDLGLVTTNYGLTLWLTGKTDKIHLWWYIGDLAPGDTARIIFLVSTDLNPAGHQEYTEPGIYEMNSGATLKFDDCTGTQLSAYTPSIYVTVLPLEDP